MYRLRDVFCDAKRLFVVEFGPKKRSPDPSGICIRKMILGEMLFLTSIAIKPGMIISAFQS